MHRRLSRASGVAVGCCWTPAPRCATEGSRSGGDDHPRGAGRPLRDGDRPFERDRRCLAVRRVETARSRGLGGPWRDPCPARPACRRRSGGDLVSAAKPTSEEMVAKALAAGDEIARATALGRSTVGKALGVLERDQTVRRHRGGPDGRRRMPDRWSIGSGAERDAPAGAATQRLRPDSSTSWSSTTNDGRLRPVASPRDVSVDAPARVGDGPHPHGPSPPRR